MSKLLIISKQADDQIFAQEVAKVAGLSLLRAKDVVEGTKIIAEDEISVVLISLSTKEDYQAFENAIQETVGLYSQKMIPNFIHFMSEVDLDGVDFLVQSPLFGHFVHSNYSGEPKLCGQHYGRIVKASLLEKAFGLSKLLDSKIRVQTIHLSSSAQKIDAIEAVKQFLVKAKFQNRTAALIANSVDELLLNAIYDAPVDAMGKSLYSQLPRSSVLKLEEQSRVEMEVGFDGTYVAISVVDHFGSLEKKKLLSHISKIYVKDDYKIKTAVAGAGIGLATVFQMGGSFFFVSEVGVKTQVTLFFKNAPNYRVFKQQFRFLSTQFYF